MPDEHCRTALQEIVRHLPFIGLAVGKVGESPLSTRLVETAIMSVVAGGFATYINVRMMEEKLIQLNRNIEESATETKEKIAEVKQEVRQIRTDIYAPSIDRLSPNRGGRREK